nr:hypothetical protein [Tanacetum cinerariifolium]
MEADSKDRSPMLAPGNYVQWKSRIKRYIDTKPNHELIHYCLKNPPYKLTWADKEVSISEEIYKGYYTRISSVKDARYPIGTSLAIAESIVREPRDHSDCQTSTRTNTRGKFYRLENGFQTQSSIGTRTNAWCEFRRLNDGFRRRICKIVHNTLCLVGFGMHRLRRTIHKLIDINIQIPLVIRCSPRFDTLSWNGNRVGFTQSALFCGGMYFELLVYIPEASTLGFVGVLVGPLFFLPTASAFSVAISAFCVAIYSRDVILQAFVVFSRSQLQVQVLLSVPYRKWIEVLHTGNSILEALPFHTFQATKQQHYIFPVAEFSPYYLWIDNDIYSTVDACLNACEMWLKQGESINVQDLETNLFWEFGKFTSHDGESLKLYYSRFYKMMNELIRNQCNVTNHQVNVLFLLQLQLEWQRFVTLVKQNQEPKTVSYHKLYDILKQHQNEVNEIRAERIARNANPLALVAQQQPLYHPQNHPTHYTQNSSTKSQQAATKNRGKAIVNSPTPIYDQESSMVAEDDEMSKEKEIDKLMALILFSFKKIYKPTNNNLRTSSNTNRANQDNSPWINRGTGYDNKRLGNVAGARETVGIMVVQKSRIQCYNCKEFGHVARECQKPKRAKDAAYHREKMLLCKQEEAGILLNAEQADWKDDTDDESDDQELEAHYMYMNDDTDDLDNERELLASLIEKLKCEIDDRKNRKKKLETSNKVLVEKLKGEIEYFKNKNKTLESSNNRFKEANNKLSETNKLLYDDFKKSQAELERRNDVEYASKMEIDCTKARGDLISYKMESQKSFNKYTQTISDLNQTISEMKKKLSAHQETISILTQQ